MKRKLPHFRFPGFKILDRYILGKFLSTYFFAIAMIIVVVVIFDYVEKIDNFTETKAPLKAIIFDYYLNFIPFFINQFSGLFTFIAVISSPRNGLSDRDRGYAFGRHEFPAADVALFPGGAHHRFALSGVEPLVDSGVAAQLRGFREPIHPAQGAFPIR